jgi:uncharacterized membrane protein
VAALIAVTAILRVLGAAASGSGAAFEQSALWDADRWDRLRDVSGIGGHRSGQANCCAHEGHACPPVCAPEYDEETASWGIVRRALCSGRSAAYVREFVVESRTL